MRALPTQGPLQRPQANRKIRTQRQHDEMEGAAQRRLSEKGRAAVARPLRPDLPRSAEVAVSCVTRVSTGASVKQFTLSFSPTVPISSCVEQKLFWAQA